MINELIDCCAVTEGSDELDVESEMVASQEAADFSETFPDVYGAGIEDSDVEAYGDYDEEMSQPDEPALG